MKVIPTEEEGIATRITGEPIDNLISFRRWFHQHPEIAYKERQTSAFIIEHLKSLGIKNIRIYAKTGVVCEIGEGKPIITCRFNMDALQIKEDSGVKFISKFDGFSHACGHDFELAWGLALAEYFIKEENKLNFTLRLAFQPAEEDSGDDEKFRTGGQWFAEEGVFNGDAAFSLHVEPELPVGTISLNFGDVTAHAYDFSYEVTGKTAHAAKPHLGVNPVPVAASLINKIYDIQNEFKKKFNDEESYLLITPSFLLSKVNKDMKLKDFDDSALMAVNTLPEVVYVNGVTRIRNKKILDKAFEMLDSLCYIETPGCKIKLKLYKRAVATHNDERLFNISYDVAKHLGFEIKQTRTTWRDDAGWCSQCVPTLHGFIGVKNEKLSEGNILHSPKFNPDERGLEVGFNLLINSIKNTADKFQINKKPLKTKYHEYA